MRKTRVSLYKKLLFSMLGDEKQAEQNPGGFVPGK